MRRQQWGHLGLRGWMVASILLAFVPLSACGQRATLLAVNASATMRTAPDLAVVTLGVVARGDTARAAQQAQNRGMAAVLQAVRAAGAAEEDVQTVGFSLEPQYAQARGSAPRIAGYISRNIVAIRIKNLGAVSALIDATVAEGANELQGVQFTFQDVEASREAARGQALVTARRRAESYAQAAGLRVVRIESIIEPGSTLAPDRRSDGFALGGVAVETNAAQIRTGQVDNDASLTVVFELKSR